MSIREHLDQVDRAEIAVDAIGAVIGGSVAVYVLLILGRHSFTDIQNGGLTAIGLLCGLVAVGCLFDVAWEIARPESLARAAEQDRYETRLDDLTADREDLLDGRDELLDRVEDLTARNDRLSAYLHDVGVALDLDEAKRFAADALAEITAEPANTNR